MLIESETGLLRLAPGAQLDYNVKKNHILEIIALDGGGVQSEVPCVVNITIKDVNNKKPKFEFNEVNHDPFASGSGNGQVTTYIQQLFIHLK